MKHILSQTDTITAIATPPGRGGIGIIRVSGPLVAAVALALLGKIPPARLAAYLPFSAEDGTHLDHGIALFFPGPNSFTGEDVLELQGHGGPVILDLLLQRILLLPGIRMARPGEFSERAFMNDRLDLAQAEAIADLINANSEQAARSAIKSLQGVFSDQINRLVEAITNLRMYIESSIDFPEEEIDSLSNVIIQDKLHKIITNIDQLMTEAQQGNLLREGMKVVIAGKPNAGKSSLLNALVGWEAAIVTSISGTTRDVLREHIHIDGMPLHIIDTAGIRNANNAIERIGIERAWREIKQADRVLLIVDGTANTDHSVSTMLCSVFNDRLPLGIPVTVVRNKADITGESVGLIDDEVSGNSLITISAKSGAGMELLREHLKHKMGFLRGCGNEGSFLARRRHIETLKKVAVHLANSKSAAASEIMAEELRLAQQYLSNITGAFTSSDLLNKIFASFCIGK